MRARKADAILMSARKLFLERGYEATSVDDVAVDAGVSKTTVYNNFEDKEALLVALIDGVTAESVAILNAAVAPLEGSGPLGARLELAGLALARGVLRPEVVQLRRLAVTEAIHFPKPVAVYWERGPAATVALLEERFRRFTENGELTMSDPTAAATNFAYAIVGPLQDRALLLPGQAPTPGEVDRHVATVTKAFLRAYPVPADRPSEMGADSLGEIGEAATLARIFPRLPAASAARVGPGDDAAVLVAPDGRYVVTTDMMIHGPDFRLAWSSGHDLGWKAAASNLADVAAMGAVPTGLVVALAVPSETSVSFLEEFADGIRDGCASMAPGCGVVGGDLSVSPTLTIAVTAFGDLEGRTPVLRSGAGLGDVVAVSGVIGAAGAGIRRLFAEGMRDGGPDAALAAALREAHPEVAYQLAPTPPIADGRLAALAGATAMIDISDGLALDARRVAKASGVALDLLLDAIGSEQDLVAGEDHSLLATFPRDTVLPGGFRAIGRVVEGAGVLIDGAAFEARGGWDPYQGWDGQGG